MADLNDPNLVTLTIPQAAALLGVSRSTAFTACHANGHLMDGVPVIRIGRLCFVSAAHLRDALGIPHPQEIGRG